MPGLRRTGVPKLLKTVQGRPYATEVDHESEEDESMRTRMNGKGKTSVYNQRRTDLTEEEIFAEPLASSDEDEERQSAPIFQLPALPAARNQSESTSSKGKRSNGFESTSDGPGDEDDDDDDKPIFSSQGSQQKRAKKATTSSFVNLHAPAGRLKTYGGGAARRPQDKKKPKPVKFRSPPKPTNLSRDLQGSSPPKPVFLRVPGVAVDGDDEVFHFGATNSQHNGKENEGAVFRRPGGDEQELAALSPSASSLSSLSQTPECEILDLSVTPHEQEKQRAAALQTLCAICSQSVSLLLRQQFEDDFTNSKPMTFKWQRRFCRHHRARSAESTWRECGYPEIEWLTLDRRMCGFHRHLRDVISGSRPSIHRESLSRKVKSGLLKTGSLENARLMGGAAVGYYGPRGEKMMTDHIIAHLSHPIREQASRDRLVAAAGVAGGVSGFVQAVLVPELAEQLVAQDLSVSVEQARKIVVDSAELGDLLFPEADERINEGFDEF